MKLEVVLCEGTQTRCVTKQSRSRALNCVYFVPHDNTADPSSDASHTATHTEAPNCSIAARQALGMNITAHKGDTTTTETLTAGVQVPLNTTNGAGSKTSLHSRSKVLRAPSHMTLYEC